MPPIYYNQQEINNIKVGNQPVSGVYHGGASVYNAQGYGLSYLANRVLEIFELPKNKEVK